MRACRSMASRQKRWLWITCVAKVSCVSIGAKAGETSDLRRIDRLGVLLSLIGITALSFLPFIVFKANRIVPGEPRALLDILPPAAASGFYACLVLAGVTALLARDPRW